MHVKTYFPRAARVSLGKYLLTCITHLPWTYPELVNMAPIPGFFSDFFAFASNLRCKTFLIFLYSHLFVLLYISIILLSCFITFAVLYHCTFVHLGACTI